MRTGLILLLFIGVAMVLGWALLASPSPQKLRMSVNLVTSTNGLTVFQVSNGSPFAVLVGQTALIEYDSPKVSPEPLHGKFKVLSSGESCFEEVEQLFNTNGVRWRFSVDCMPHEGEVRSFIRGVLPPSFSPREAWMVHFASDWIQP